MSASWRLGLVILAIFPLLTGGAIFEFRSIAWLAVGSGTALERAADVASEAVAAIRTVSAFNLQVRAGGARQTVQSPLPFTRLACTCARQARTLDTFSARLSGTVRAALRQGATAGTGRGFSQFMTLASYSLGEGRPPPPAPP